MSIHREGADLDRITVKIHNMKRSASRSPGRGNLVRNSRSMGRGYDNGGGVPGDSPSVYLRSACVVAWNVRPVPVDAMDLRIVSPTCVAHQLQSVLLAIRSCA